jgi:hypothetical protein
MFSDVMVNKWAYVEVAFFLLNSYNKIPKFGTPVQNTLNMYGEVQYFSVETSKDLNTQIWP